MTTGPISKKAAVVSGGELTGAILRKGMIVDRGPPLVIASVKNVWTKPHQGAKEIARRKARLERLARG